MICRANQWTGSYMIESPFMKELNTKSREHYCLTWCVSSSLTLTIKTTNNVKLILSIHSIYYSFYSCFSFIHSTTFQNLNYIFFITQVRRLEMVIFLFLITQIISLLKTAQKNGRSKLHFYRFWENITLIRQRCIQDTAKDLWWSFSAKIISGLYFKRLHRRCLTVS